jgi:hypothetical protein
MVMSLYKDKIRDHAIHAALTDVYDNDPSADFIAAKISYKYTLKQLIREMKKEINKIDNDLEL